MSNKRWLFLLLGGFIVAALSGCVYNEDDDDNNDNDEQADTASGTLEVGGKGSPGYGALGGLTALLSAGWLAHRRIRRE